MFVQRQLHNFDGDPWVLTVPGQAVARLDFLSIIMSVVVESMMSSSRSRGVGAGASAVRRCLTLPTATRGPLDFTAFSVEAAC
jgi:hypothetical protein